MISRAPDGFMLQQHMQHIIRTVWRHMVMVECLYLNSRGQSIESQP
jgi:hypothetical protein